MDKGLFDCLEKYMIEWMADSAHDKEHVYRVLYLALDIANHESCNQDVLIAACLLHDIGRGEQYKNPQICHARVGAERAYHFCIRQGFPDVNARHIRDCIATHRYRGDDQPASLEAKILFDADKLDATGTLGIARTLFYKGHVGEPLYHIDERGDVLDGTDDPSPSFFQEYNYKLKNLYHKFYTDRAYEIAKERQQAAVLFYESMLKELSSTYQNGHRYLNLAVRLSDT